MTKEKKKPVDKKGFKKNRYAGFDGKPSRRKDLSRWASTAKTFASETHPED